LTPSYLQPADKPVPMVATRDVARVAVELLLQDWQGKRIVELEGPARVTPNEIAACLGRLLKRDVQVQTVPRDTWEATFRSTGMRNPMPRMQMLDGFNAGWIEFEGGEHGSRKGDTALEAVLKDLVAMQP
jgi:NAD(P)H dehydrogenase (quinone)